MVPTLDRAMLDSPHWPALHWPGAQPLPDGRWAGPLRGSRDCTVGPGAFIFPAQHPDPVTLAGHRGPSPSCWGSLTPPGPRVCDSHQSPGTRGREGAQGLGAAAPPHPPQALRLTLCTPLPAGAAVLFTGSHPWHSLDSCAQAGLGLRRLRLPGVPAGGSQHWALPLL